MWLQGDTYRAQKMENANVFPKHLFGIYSIKSKSMDYNQDNDLRKEVKHPDNVSRILQKVDTMKLYDQEDENKNEHCCRRRSELIEVSAIQYNIFILNENIQLHTLF